jgi:hypothetical protein
VVILLDVNYDVLYTKLAFFDYHRILHTSSSNWTSVRELIPFCRSLA